MPSDKFVEESINIASWLKLIFNLQRFGATFILLKKDTLITINLSKHNTIFLIFESFVSSSDILKSAMYIIQYLSN